MLPTSSVTSPDYFSLSCGRKQCSIVAPQQALLDTNSAVHTLRLTWGSSTSALPGLPYMTRVHPSIAS